MYRVKDPLDNLVLRVRLRKINVVRILNETTNQDIEELTFKWQEKYFSTVEKELYRREDALSPLHNHYVSLLSSRGERNNNKRLFTYTSQDHYHPNVEEKQVKRKGKSRQTMFVMADLQNVENGPEFDEKLLVTISVDSDGVMILSHDLSHDNNEWYRIESNQREIFEYQLFNDSRPITTDELKREKELHSKLQSHQRERLWQSIGENFEPLPDQKSSRYIHVLGSIETADGFGDTPLYVTLRLRPLNEVYQLQYGSEAIVSQLCSPNTHHEATFNCPFEFRLLYTEAPPTDETTPTQTTPPPLVLSLEVSSLDYWDRHRTEGYVTNYNLPLSPPGTRTLRVSTCRPHPSTLIEQLTRYFIGSPPLYDEWKQELIGEGEGGGEGGEGRVGEGGEGGGEGGEGGGGEEGEGEREEGEGGREVGREEGKQKERGKAVKRSRFGSQTVSSGNVTIKVNIIYHSHQCADRFSSQQELKETLRTEPKLYSFVKASDAYRRARTKALQLLNSQSL